MKKKILISTGGSGGHVIPATVFYDYLKKDFDVLLTVEKRGKKFINEKKYNFNVLFAPRLSLNIIKIPISLISLFISIFNSLFFLKKNKINILIGTGGYMSFPLCIAAKLLNLKIYLFEPNMVIGKANKFLLKFSNKIFCYSHKIINFPKKYKDKIVIIEHILRKEILKFKKRLKEKIDNRIKLLVIGGSQGAKIFDQNLKNSILYLSKKCKLKVYHQVSSKNLGDLKVFYKKNKIENKLFNFNENIFDYIDESNLAITRAGASTLAELAFFNVPFIAIPYKFATDNHQLENSLFYKSKNYCWVLEEDEFNKGKLNELLINIIKNNDDYLIKKKNLEKFCYKSSWNNINQKIINSINEN